MNDLFQFYSYAAFMYWPAAFVAKVALLSALLAVVGGNQNPGQKLLTGVLAAHLIMSCFILFVGLINLGLPFGPRAIRVPVGEPVAVLALAVGATVALCLFAPSIAWKTRSEEGWANWVFWIAMVIAIVFPFFNDSTVGAVIKSPLAILPHPTLLAGCALAWMTGRDAHRIAALAFIAGAALLGFYDAIVWGIASSWILIAFAAVAAISVLAPDFRIPLPTFGGPREPKDPAPRKFKEPKATKGSEAPKWKLK